MTLSGLNDEKNIWKKILRVVSPDFSFKIAYCDISALEYAYALKIDL